MDMSSGIGYVHSAQFSIITGNKGSMKKPMTRREDRKEKEEK